MRLVYSIPAGFNDQTFLTACRVAGLKLSANTPGEATHGFMIITDQIEIEINQNPDGMTDDDVIAIVNTAMGV